MREGQDGRGISADFDAETAVNLEVDQSRCDDVRSEVSDLVGVSATSDVGDPVADDRDRTGDQRIPEKQLAEDCQFAHWLIRLRSGFAPRSARIVDDAHLTEPAMRPDAAKHGLAITGMAG